MIIHQIAFPPQLTSIFTGQNVEKSLPVERGMVFFFGIAAVNYE